MADVDHRENAVAPAELTAREQRRTRTAKLRTRMAKLESGAPTPSDLGQIFEDTLKGGVGSADAMLALAGDMERRDPHYRAQLSVRKLAVGSVSTALKGGDDRSMELCQRVIDSSWYGTMAFNLLDGLGKSYAVCELHWETGEVWIPTGYKFRDPRHFSWDEDGVIGERDPEKPDTTNPLPAYVYAVHTPHLISGPVATRGLAWPCAFWSMAKSFSIKDWLALAEIFGIPIRVGKYSSEATPEDKEALWDAINDIGQEAAAIIHKGTEIVLQSASGSTGSAEALYRACIDVCNAEMSKAISGQTMTMEDGASLSQAQVHSQVLSSFDETTAKALVATINRDVLIPMQCLNFGESDDPTVLYVPEREDEDMEHFVSALAPLIDRGFRVSEAEIREKLGLKEPEEGEAVLRPIAVVEAVADDGDGDEGGDD